MSGTINAATAHHVSETGRQSWEKQVLGGSPLAQGEGACLPDVGLSLINR